MSEEIQTSDEANQTEEALSPCSYTRSNGMACRFKAIPGKDHCFWHDPDVEKTAPLVGPLLVRHVNENVNLEGFQLRGIDIECRRLAGAQLIHANLEDAHLFKAHLEGAHLFGANLSNASLFKTFLDGANLRTADLSNANLLGATLKGTKLEGIKLGRKGRLVNERTGNEESHKGNHSKAKKSWHEAEEIYLSLLNNHKEAGRHEEASEVFYRMMVVKRKLMPLFSVHRWGSWFMDVICGYGERPGRVIMAGLILIVFSALFFFIFGIQDSNSTSIGFDFSADILSNLKAFITCVYFSIITMTTTGYGDLTPTVATRLFAATEAFAGAFLMAVFVLVFGRKMMR